jgi:cyanophycinase
MESRRDHKHALPIRRAAGTLVIIGGREDKEGDKDILRYVAREVGGGKLVVVTAASERPQELWAAYEPLFRSLGVRHLAQLAVADREDAHRPSVARTLQDADGIFITGGDQLRLTSALGDSIVFQRMREIFEQGGVVAGTSAGASVMSETMLVGGAAEASPRIGGELEMAPGFGLAAGILIDQHFAERGRTGRLVGAIARNPRIIGVGIDEDTAIVIRGNRTFEVLGAGAVTIIDGSRITRSSVTEDEEGRSMSVFDVRMHLLSQGDAFDLRTREPKNRPAAEAARRLLGQEPDENDGARKNDGEESAGGARHARRKAKTGGKR